MRDGGCYGHVDGPRFNTRAEIRGLAACGVTAVSQTGGPETMLCGEAELPYALLGYATDYANGVQDEPTPVQTLLDMMAASTETFASVLAAAVPRAAAAELAPAGMVYRFEGPSGDADARRGAAGDAQVLVAERLRAAEAAADADAVVAVDLADLGGERAQVLRPRVAGAVVAPRR